VRILSTKRQPASLVQPKLRRRHSTARRIRRSLGLFVGSTPSTVAKFHNADSRAIRFSQNFATVASSPNAPASSVWPQRRDRGAQPLTVDRAGLEGVPGHEQFADDPESAAAHKSAGAAAFGNFAEVPFQGGPAQLPPLFGHLQIHVPAVSLILDHLDRRRLNLHDLKPLRFRIARRRFAQQRFVAGAAALGHDGLEVRDALGRQELFQMRRMPRLTAATPLGLLLDDRRRGVEGIGGRRQGRVAGIGVELGFESRHALEQIGDDGVTPTALRALRKIHVGIHAESLANAPPFSCATFRGKLY
jgi:hypothetical protein